MRCIAHRSARIALCALVAMFPVRIASAQSASPISLQLSGTGLFVDGGITPGAEAQLRWSAVKFSLGVGYQMFRYEGGATERILFAEPRLVLSGNDVVGLYVAGRVYRSVVRVDVPEEVFVDFSQIFIGGGGGLLIVLGRKTLLDLGAQYYGAMLQLRAGLSFGF